MTMQGHDASRPDWWRDGTMLEEFEGATQRAAAALSRVQSTGSDGGRRSPAGPLMLAGLAAGFLAVRLVRLSFQGSQGRTHERT